MQNINTVAITGNLTKDVALRSTRSGTSVADMRVAVNGRRKDASGEWVDDPNYFTVIVWGRLGELCAEYLSKGRGVAVHGRLDWSEWETDQGGKRESVKIIAENVQFLGDGKSRSGERSTSGETTAGEARAAAEGAKSGSRHDDDIPF